MRSHKHTFLLLVVTAALALSACDNKQQSAATPVKAPAEVGTVIVQPQNLAIATELPGRTSAYRIAEVRPQVNGIITKRLFREGSDVKAGEQLYQIDPATYQAALDSAKADVAKSQANLKATQAKASRYGELVKINAISRQDYDDIVASLDQGVAQVKVSEAAVRTAQINLDYTKVYAPISGRIGKSSVTEGALVTANQADRLASIQQFDPIYVDVTQSSDELMKLRSEISAGHVQGSDPDKTVVSLTLQSGQPYSQKGQLQFSDVTVDQTTGSVTLRAIFPNPHHDLLPGMFVRATVDQGSRDNAIVVSQRAVVRNPDGSTYVWLVGADKKVTQHPVKTVQAVGDTWLISDGLQSGDQVVVEGLQKIKPGIEVKAVAAQSTTTQTP